MFFCGLKVVEGKMKSLVSGWVLEINGFKNDNEIVGIEGLLVLDSRLYGFLFFFVC